MHSQPTSSIIQRISSVTPLPLSLIHLIHPRLIIKTLDCIFELSDLSHSEATLLNNFFFF